MPFTYRDGVLTLFEEVMLLTLQCPTQPLKSTHVYIMDFFFKLPNLVSFRAELIASTSTKMYMSFKQNMFYRSTQFEKVIKINNVKKLKSNILLYFPYLSDGPVCFIMLDVSFIRKKELRINKLRKRNPDIQCIFQTFSQA